MGYLIRFFTTSPLMSMIPIQAQMYQAGFEVQPAGTNALDIYYDPNYPPLTADLAESTKEDAKADIMAFIEAVTDYSDHPAQRKVLNVLSRTQAIIAIGIPNDFPDSHQGSLNELLALVADMAEGLFHVEGEGFYDGANLIFEL